MKRLLLLVVVAVLAASMMVVFSAVPTAAAVQAVVRDWWRFRHGATAQAPPLVEGAEPEPG